jgi:hypothetical protein
MGRLATDAVACAEDDEPAAIETDERGVVGNFGVVGSSHGARS